jgi:hypothetical protein
MDQFGVQKIFENLTYQKRSIQKLGQSNVTQPLINALAYKARNPFFN